MIYNDAKKWQGLKNFIVLNFNVKIIIFSRNNYKYIRVCIILNMKKKMVYTIVKYILRSESKKWSFKSY